LTGFIILCLENNGVRMITCVWRPKIKKNKNINEVQYYEIVDDYTNLSKGWKVSYICDRCLDSKINNTTSHVLLDPKVIYNTIEKQVCRKCRSEISEYEIKKNFIPYNKIKESFTHFGYITTSSEIEYNNSKRRSQFKFKLICPNNHTLTATWNNWEKGKRCRQCYEKNKHDNAVKNKKGWNLYKYNVWKITEQTYKQNLDIINPNNFQRGFEYHLDHKFSVSEGFRNGILPYVIGGVENLEIIPSLENLKKNNK
jgi:hypothetical protein